MKTIILSFLLLLVTFSTKAQVIHGVVIDSASSQPLKAVTITSKSSKKTTLTNSRGQFKLLIAEHDTLILQSIGYQTLQKPVKPDGGQLQLKMAPKSNNLSDVLVNTGYQTLPKERATGSFELIDSKTLQGQISSDILSRLKGTTSILFDEGGGNRPKLTIRGLSSINGDKSPLVVLDNFPYNGDINNINPNDVESVTILKDAAAASIWGTKASNGVIVITTKKARLNQPLDVTLNANITITQKPDLSYTRQMSSSDFIDVEKFLFDNKFKFSDTASASHPSFTPAYEILFKERNGQISSTQAENELNDLRNKSVFDDFDKYIYQPQITQQYALNIDGGSARDAFHIAGSFDRNVNQTEAQNNRITIHITNDLNITKSLKVSTSLMYNNSRSTSGKPTFENLRFGLYPYAQLADMDGTPLPINKYYRQPYVDTIGGGMLLDWKYYPLDDYKHNLIHNTTDDLLGNLNINYSPIPQLDFSVHYQYEKQKTASKTLHDQDGYYTRDYINRFTQINRTTGQIKYIIPLGGILDQTFAKMEAQNLRAQVDYHQTFTDHDISIIVGSEIRNIENNSTGDRIYGYDDNILTYGKVDYINTYPTMIPGYKQYIPNGIGVSATTNRFVSLLANGAYTYKQRYILSASARRDASNLFGVNTNDKWTPLWSVGGAWILNKERFWESNTINYLKLRTTYGFSGNVDQSRSAVTTLKYFSGARYTNYNLAGVVQLANPDLRWEKTAMWNIGIDFGLKNDILSGSIEYYHKRGSDLFGDAPMDWTSAGQDRLVKNVADMTGNGWDFNLNSNLINKAIKWRISTKTSIVHTKVTKYFNTGLLSSSFINDGSSINPIVGKPVYSILSYQWAGLDHATGDPLGYLDGKSSSDYSAISNQNYNQLVYGGSATPTLFGNLINTFTYKNLSLTANIGYKFGHYYRKPSLNYYNLFYNKIGDIEYIKRWQQPGDETKTNVPSMVYPDNSTRDNLYNHSEVLVEKADNIRFQYISIGYQIAKTNHPKLPFKAINFTAFINNIGLLWRAGDKTIDPDYIGSQAPLRSFALQCKFNF